MKKWIWGLLCASHLSLAVAAVLPTDEAQAVAASLRAQWEKPDLPMQIPVIVVQEDVAIADWLLGEKGGRALLRKQHGGWHTLLCGGSELVFAHRLQGAGVSAATAEILSQQLRQREQSLPVADRQRLDSFQGVMDFTRPPEGETEHHHGH